ncbi:protein of unknown function DUF1767 [Macleaya cordata]|uniref:RecQ-mediated genome instability protein 1 n=1 Tax=Macleaya cordata TaxID=56857 RepID=A0A200R402_MACCD|nr:protein of unknown function DUF1767 [Macleaya cordata]
MSRRRLRLQCSSDEEEEEEGRGGGVEQEPEVGPTEVLNSSNPNPNPIDAPPEVLPFEISDEDFVDVPEEFSPPSPPMRAPNHSFQDSTRAPTNPAFFSGGSRDCLIHEFLRNLGLKLRTEWLDSCIYGMSNSVPGFASFNVAGKAKLCFEEFLFSDMNLSGGGVLPENVHSLHLVDLAGPYVLQVDEIVNISCHLRDRYQNAPAGMKRCLKLCMTDGVQRVYGMEYRPIKDLEVLAPSGLKVVIRNVNVRRGLLMLVPEVLEVLGGVVEDLDAARQRLVEEVNKPPRGKRTRTGVVPSLASRATLAAWPPNGVSDHGNADNSTSQGAMPSRSSDQAIPCAPPGIGTRERILEEFDVPNSIFNVERIPSFSTAAGFNEINMAYATAAMSGIDITEPTIEEFAGHNRRRSSAEPSPSSNAVPDVGDIDMVDEVEDPLILTGDREIPFTYLASLLANWAMKKDDTQFIQGKIKCFLTGVKGFQFKERTTYELQVYVDDGSLISEVCIDHNVVQKGIGYSPEQVTAALSSSNKNVVGQMKETMKQFQIFLANFEGTMLVELNKSSSLPVAIEMNQGCSTSDAWLLLRRLKMFTAPQTPQHQHSEPITISP